MILSEAKQLKRCHPRWQALVSRLSGVSEDFKAVTCMIAGVVVDDSSAGGLGPRTTGDLRHLKTGEGMIWEIAARYEHISLTAAISAMPKHRPEPARSCRTDRVGLKVPSSAPGSRRTGKCPAIALFKKLQFDPKFNEAMEDSHNGDRDTFQPNLQRRNTHCATTSTGKSAVGWKKPTNL